MPRTELNVTSLSLQRFAPRAEHVVVTFDPANPRRFDQFVFEVTDNQGRVVFQNIFDAWRSGTAWDGRGDVAAPLNPARYVSPLGAPYRLCFYGQNTRMGQSLPRPFAAFLRKVGDTKDTLSTLVANEPIPAITQHTVNVFYHSIELTWGEWLPREEVQRLDGVLNPLAGAHFAAANFTDPDVILWVWGKLGKLGYYPGPAAEPPAPNNAMGKAIIRYRQANKALYSVIFKEGANYTIDGVKERAAAAIDAPLLSKLHANENNRFDLSAPSAQTLIDQADVLSNVGAKSRLYADVDRYYIGLGTEFSGDMKAAVDRDWTPRPMLPLKVRVRLQTSTGAAADTTAPGAAGDCKLLWKWQDRAETTGHLPVYSSARPSQTKRYIDKALLAAEQKIPSPHKNARTVAGGLVSGTDPDDARAPFAAMGSFALSNAPDGVHTQPSSNAQAAGWADCTQVFFQPSNIAGDNYKLTVKLDLSAAPPGVQNSHAGVAAALSKQTGEFEIWRRTAIAAYVKWGDVQKVPDWNAIAAHFDQAYTKLLPPAETIRIVDLIDPGKAALATWISDFFRKEKLWSRERGKTACTFSADYLYPEDPRSIEFTNLSAIGEAQFASPKNVINELMILLLTNDFDGWRQNSALPPEKKVPPPDKQLARRYEFVKVLDTFTDWRKTVATHFKAEIERIWDPITKKCRDIPDNVDRTLRPLRHDDPGLGTAPARRSEILRNMLRLPIAATLGAWAAGNDAPAGLANLKTVRALVVGMKTEIGVFDKATDKEKKVPVCPVLRAVVEDLSRLFDTDCGTGTTIAYNLHKQNIELVVAADPPPPELKATLEAAPYRATDYALKRASANRDASYVLAKVATPDTFDLVAFNTAVPSAIKAWSFRQLRGARATLPTFAMPLKEEAALNKRHLIAQAEFQIDFVILKLGPLITQSLFPEIPAAIHAAIRSGVAADHRPAGGLIIVHYRGHPRPLPIKTGSAADLDDLTNSTSLGLDGGLVFCSDDQPLTVEHLFTHEIAHCLFVRHWQQGREVISHFGYPNDHDLVDTNCMMSYSAFELEARWGAARAPCRTHFKVSDYRPYFCGKCNLKLRGWDLNAQHGGGPLLPTRSFDVTLLNPAAPSPTINTISSPDPADLQAQTEDLLAHKLLVTSARKMAFTGDTLRFLGNPTHQHAGDKQFFRWVPVAATTLDKNQTIKCTGNYDLHGDEGGVQRTDPEIIGAYNDNFGSAWERNLEYYFLSGGATNVPRDILFNPHWSMYTDDTPIHEAIHVYQNWDPSRIAYEGMTELFGLMLSKLMRNALPGVEAQKLKLTLNPTYVQGTQFVVDEILPRIGWHGLAQLYFENNTTVLDKILNAGGFPDKCEACSKVYDMSGAVAMMLPKSKRPPVDDVLHSSAGALCQSALTELNEYLAARNRYGFGPAERSLHAKVIRLDAKIKAFEDALAAAETFRPRVTETDRIHRLEAWIEETKLQLIQMKYELP